MTTADIARLTRGDHAAIEAFILANTKLIRPPLVPELELHLAEESLPIWQKTEEELGEINLPPPFWAFAWAGGQALARYILDNAALVAGMRVLDLGSGSGLAGLAAMKAGAASVLAADIDELAFVAARANATANGLALEATSVDLLSQPWQPFDVILVGDLFYERGLADRVLDFVDGYARDGALVLIGDPGRNYFPKDRFENAAEYQVPVTRDLEDAEIKNSAVWRYRIL